MNGRDRLKIAVVGAGAIGGITAAFLAEAGYDVELVCNHEDTARLANGDGLSISGVRGTRRVKVGAVTGIDRLSGQKDAILLAVKAYDLPGVLQSCLPFLSDQSLVVSMQNGICTDAVAEIAGQARTVGCVIGWGATMHGRGELEMTSEGEFVIGGLEPGMEERLEPLRQALSAVVPARVSPDIYAELYSKLIVNSCITSLGAICGLRLGEMMKRKRARELFLGIIFEAMAVAEAIGVRIPPYAGKLDYYKLCSGKGFLPDWKRHMMIRVMGLKYRRLKSSSLQSLERGKPTEIDFFNGYICRKGAECGVKTPVNDAVVAVIRQIESGKHKPEPTNFGLPEFQDLAR